MKLSKSN